MERLQAMGFIKIDPPGTFCTHAAVRDIVAPRRKTLSGSRLRLILNDYTLWPLFVIQRLFYRTGLGVPMFGIGLPVGIHGETVDENRGGTFVLACVGHAKIELGPFLRRQRIELHALHGFAPIERSRNLDDLPWRRLRSPDGKSTG